MASTNEHLPPPPKPRMSPLEFRNTDLVSRLLAATPPYLYNMSLLPNTYFFSEMLRSFVQAKAERSSSFHPPIRRSRKRNWPTSRSEYYGKPSTEPKTEDLHQETMWNVKTNKKTEENPLELTISKPETDHYHTKIDNFNTKVEPNTTDVFGNLHQNIQQDNNPQNLVLPPPPPMWYPPLYPTPPYGIDPLHFFIDLKVSGHIYDRKNIKEQSRESPPKEKIPHTEVSNFKQDTDLSNTFKQTRNGSAFSVPNPNKTFADNENRSKKFDVKSMGFDKSQNKTSTNYVMSNISNIYKCIYDNRDQNMTEGVEHKQETEEEKKVKDLRALIGLELVVDYMKHKPERPNHEESSTSSDIESIGSPTLEVVDENWLVLKIINFTG